MENRIEVDNIGTMYVLLYIFNSFIIILTDTILARGLISKIPKDLSGFGTIFE